MIESDLFRGVEILSRLPDLVNNCIRVERPAFAHLVQHAFGHQWESMGAETIVYPDQLLLTEVVPDIGVEGDEINIRGWRIVKCKIGGRWAPSVFRISGSHADSVTVLLPNSTGVVIQNTPAYLLEAGKPAGWPDSVYLQRLGPGGYSQVEVQLPYHLQIPQ